MTEDEKNCVNDFAKAILHGDERHRDWLLAAAKAFTEDKPIPAMSMQPSPKSLGPGQSATTADMKRLYGN